jgi:ATP-dependent Clp protease adapter protein ClpS
MAKLKYRTVHVSVRDPAAWQLLADLHTEGWSIVWSDYAEYQWHFLLVGDE